MDSKAQTLALLGSIDFSLEDLEKHVLNQQIIPQIFAAMSGEDAILAEEAAVCVKNLMTNEHLGSKSTRRLYALCIFPLLNQILENIFNETRKFSSNFVEAIAVQVWCIASAIPAALPQINASPLAALVSKRLAVTATSSGASEIVNADNVLLQALLVSVEDNEALAQKLIQMNPAFISEGSFQSARFDASHLNELLRFMCYLQIIRSSNGILQISNFSLMINFLFSTLRGSLPDSGLFETDSMAVKIFFEIMELAAEALEILIAEFSGSKSLKGVALEVLEVFLQLPFTLHNYYEANFKRSFEEEGNADRIRLVRRIFSIMGTLLSIQEHLINSKTIKVPRNQSFLQKMESILVLSTAGPSEDFNLKDEVSGWIRSWLTAWGDDCDFPTMPESLFSTLLTTFQASSSPVVLTNTCACLAMLIPYAPEALQRDFCVFLNNMLCTDPFDQDHLEILLAAVDAVTGIFDPKSKEWPAKPLIELKSDIETATGRLKCALNNAENGLRDLINERIRSLDRIHRIL